MSKRKELTVVGYLRTNDSGVHHVQLARKQGNPRRMQGSWDPRVWDTLGFRAYFSSLLLIARPTTIMPHHSLPASHRNSYPSITFSHTNMERTLLTTDQPAPWHSIFLSAVSALSMPSTSRIYSNRTFRVVLLYPAIPVPSSSCPQSSYPHIRVSTFISSYPTPQTTSSS